MWQIGERKSHASNEPFQRRESQHGCPVSCQVSSLPCRPQAYLYIELGEPSAVLELHLLCRLESNTEAHSKWLSALKPDVLSRL